MSRRDSLARLREAAPVILPSMLACDFSNLEREVQSLEAAGAQALHLDVMDGHFVPNLTFGMMIVKALRSITELTLDVHLMISDPAAYAEPFFDAGADIITIHVEAIDDPRPVLEQIRRLGAGAGLAINPPTPLSAVSDECLEMCDLVLPMSVMPGFGGQAFDPVALDKLRELRRRTEGRVLLEVDGGINDRTTPEVAAAGADLLVIGTAFFEDPDYAESLTKFKHLATSA